MEIKILQVGSLGTNCYLLCDEAERACAVVDPGGEAPYIAATVEKLGYTPQAIFLTHGHDDHVAGVERLQALWPEVPVYLNHRDIYEGDARVRRLFPPVPNTQNYDEGDTFTVGGLTVEVLATPGHSEGSVTLRCGDALFCGDTLFAGSMGRTDFVGGSMEKIMASLKRLGQLEGNLRVLPGHMDVSDLDRERQTNPYLRQAMSRF